MATTRTITSLTTTPNVRRRLDFSKCVMPETIPEATYFRNGQEKEENGQNMKIKECVECKEARQCMFSKRQWNFSIKSVRRCRECAAKFLNNSAINGRMTRSGQVVNKPEYDSDDDFLEDNLSEDEFDSDCYSDNEWEFDD